MPPLAFAVGIAGRPRVGLPTLRTVNAYIEKTDGGPESGARIPRPGLDYAYTIGEGPILRQYQEPGFFNGDLFSISGGQFYRNSTLIDGVPYGLNPRMAGNSAVGQLGIVAGGALYVYNGTELTLVEFFNDGVSPLPSFSGIAVLYNIFILPVVGSNEWFYSAVGDVTNISAANFSSAQVNPDIIVEAQILAEQIAFFKGTSVEWWDYNPIENAQGQVTAPFQETEGRTYARGCASQGSVVRLDNALFWVGDDLAVYRTSAVPVKVSTPLIDDRLRFAGTGVAQVTAFTVAIEGHVFYVLNMPTIGESFAYDCQTQQWAQWGTQIDTQAEPSTFIASCAATTVGQTPTIYLGSMSDGTVWTLDAESNLDGGTAKRVVVSGAHWMMEGVTRCNNVSLHCVRGVGNMSAPNPIVEMRFSDDGARTWTPWSQGYLGMSGQYAYKATWRNLGLMQQPGRVFEFAVSDPALFVAEGASINAARV